MKTPRGFFKPLAIGAPQPLRELPVRVERMIHFVPPHHRLAEQQVLVEHRPHLVAAHQGYGADTSRRALRWIEVVRSVNG